MDLSIIIVTINRKDKVVRGIKSCLNSKLPVKTEFVIVDNGCVDDTETAVKDVLDKSKYNYHYIRFEENTGASFARNAGIKKASGEILFFMDDDACIADKNYDTFFEKGIEVLKNNSKIGSVTTAIWDETLKMYRKTRRG
ncbi:MAG: glycosyltransferase family 2 protein, partial [Clostridia bacterium]|nr:glycosyltransferase family 2 protein [Clostridia bacterium]